MVLENITRAIDSTTIVCLAKNDNFKVQGSSRITVLYPPTFLDSSILELKVLYGDKKQILCEAEANPPATFKWTTTLFEETLVVSNNGSFDIDSSIKGKYDCTAENRIGSASRTVKIIQQPRKAPEVKVTKKFHDEGVEISCECNDCLPLYHYSIFHERYNNSSDEFYYDNINVTVKEHSGSFAYTVYVNEIDDLISGQWICDFRNILGSDRKNVQVYKDPKIEAITVQVKNRERTFYESANLTLLENDDMILDCVYDGVSASMSLYENEVLLQKNDYGKRVFLEIEELRESDSSTYTCVLENPAGKVSQYVNIIVESAPKYSITVEVKKGLAGYEMTLNCEIYANPSPTYEWYVDGTRLDSGRFSINNSKLVFMATPADSGIFTCVGTNSHGSIQLNYTVEIQEAPKILSAAQNITIRVSNDAHLNCLFSGTPEPSVTWTKENSTAILSLNSSLTLKHVNFEDSGSYICRANNTIGSNQLKHHLLVTGE